MPLVRASVLLESTYMPNELEWERNTVSCDFLSCVTKFQVNVLHSKILIQLEITLPTCYFLLNFLLIAAFLGSSA